MAGIPLAHRSLAGQIGMTDGGYGLFLPDASNPPPRLASGDHMSDYIDFHTFL